MGSSPGRISAFSTRRDLRAVAARSAASSRAERERVGLGDGASLASAGERPGVGVRRGDAMAVVGRARVLHGAVVRPSRAGRGVPRARPRAPRAQARARVLREEAPAGVGARRALGVGVRPGRRPAPAPEVLAVVVNDPDDASRCLAPIASSSRGPLTRARIRHVCVYDQDGYAREGAERLAELVVRAATVVRGGTRTEAEGPRPDAGWTGRPSRARTRFASPPKTASSSPRRGSRVRRRRPRAPKPLSRRERRSLGRRDRGRWIGNGNGEGAAVSRCAHGGVAREDHGEPRDVTVGAMAAQVDLLRGGTQTGPAFFDATRAGGARLPRTRVTGCGDGPAPSNERWMDRRGVCYRRRTSPSSSGRHFHLSGYPAWRMHRAEIRPQARPPRVRPGRAERDPEAVRERLGLSTGSDERRAERGGGFRGSSPRIRRRAA